MRNVLKLAGVIAAIALVAAGIWFMQSGASYQEPHAAEGLVVVGTQTAAPTAAPPPVRTTSLPAMPDKVVAQVRAAYPLLDDVDFACDTKGCAVTATIPPPTNDEFLQKRQEMLLGGLAKTIEANGYRTVGPVKMDEVAFNTFHIRASIAQAPGQGR